MKKGLIITGAVLLFLGAVLFTVAFAVSGFSFSGLDRSRYEENTYTPRGSFNRIEIKTVEADVRLLASTDNFLKVDCVELETEKHTVTVENGILKIEAQDKRTWYDRVTFFSAKPQSVTVYLPANTYDSLNLTTGTGSVSVSEALRFVQADIRGSTGDVKIASSVEGTLKIKTSTGDVRVTDTEAENLEISVSTGRVECRNIKCKKDFSVTVSTGRASLEDVTCTSFVSEGSTGELKLKNTAASASINIRRNTGDVKFDRCDAVEITVRTSTGDVSGSLLSSKSFVTKTSTGKINVPESSGSGICRITTSTGDIDIEIFS